MNTVLETKEIGLILLILLFIMIAVLPVVPAHTQEMIY